MTPSGQREDREDRNNRDDRQPSEEAGASTLLLALRTAYATLARVEAVPEQRAILAGAVEAVGRALRLLGGRRPRRPSWPRAVSGNEVAAALGGVEFMEAREAHARSEGIPVALPEGGDTQRVETLRPALVGDSYNWTDGDGRYAEEALRLIEESSTALAGPIAAREALGQVAALAVPRLADVCVIELLDDEEALRPLAAAGIAIADASSAGTGSGAIAEARGEGGESSAPILLDGAPRKVRPALASVLRTGRSLLLDGGEAQRVMAELDPRVAARAPGSLMVVALVAHGRPVGLMAFATFASLSAGTPARRFTPADLAVAEEIARRSALSVDNARLHDEARRAVRIRDEFLSIASHELKTPITLLSLEIQGLLRDARRSGLRNLSEDRVIGRLENAEGGIKRLTRMVSELLDVARIEGTDLPLQLEEVDLARNAAAVAARFAEPGAHGGDRITVRTLGDDGRGVTGFWDRMRVEQVLMNLLSNAIKFGAKKPVEITVSVDGGDAVLQVTDHGIGIAREDHARIFGRFERAVSERNFGGLGLGLYFIKQIVDAHGGTVRVDSEKGAGSTFPVRLPRSGPPSRQAPAEPLGGPLTDGA